MYTMNMMRNAKTSSFSYVPHTHKQTYSGSFHIRTMINALTVIDFCGYIKSYSFVFDDYTSLSPK